MTLVIVAVVAATVLSTRSSSTDASDDQSDQSSTASTEANLPQNVSLQLSKPVVAVQGAVTATASLMPAGETSAWTLQVFDEGTWADVGTDKPDRQGVLSYNFQAPGAAGTYLYRVALGDARGAQFLSSEAVPLRVERLPTQQVAVSWPKSPVDYCASAGVVVEVRPAASREIVLQTSADGRRWVDVSKDETDDVGRVRLDTGPCREVGAPVEDASWRVLAPETPAYEAARSDQGRIAWCPAPQELTARAIFTGPTSIAVVNPSATCAAYVNLGAEFVCSGLDSPEGSRPIGYRQSTPPMLIGPGQTRIFEPASVFTDSERRCRDYDPSFTLFAIPDSLEAWAESFTAP